MIVFVNGGSGSGKSAFAESVAQQFGGDLIYVATMPVFSEEDLRKVERHHKLRAGKGFQTLERPKLLTDIPDNGETVLIECMSTHTANVMYDTEIDWTLQDTQETDFLYGSGAANKGVGFPCKASKTDTVFLWTERIFRELKPILNRSGHTIFVSAETGADGTVYDQETENYKRVLIQVNNYLMEHADAGFEVVCGIPIKLKGEFTC